MDCRGSGGALAERRRSGGGGGGSCEALSALSSSDSPQSKCVGISVGELGSAGELDSGVIETALEAPLLLLPLGALKLEL